MAQTMTAAFVVAKEKASEQKVDQKKERARQAALAFADWNENSIRHLQRITASRCPGLPWVDVEEGISTALLEIVEKERHDLMWRRPGAGQDDLPLFGLARLLAYWRTNERRTRMEFRNRSLEHLIDSTGDKHLPADDIRMREVATAGLEIRLLCEEIRHLLDTTTLDTAEIAQELGIHKWIVLYVRREHRQGTMLRKKPPKWTRVTIVETLQKIARDKGRPPYTSDMSGHSGVHDPSIPSVTSCIELFGSWVAAKKAAGFHDQPPTEHEAALKIRTWFLANGRWPNAADFRAHDDLPGCGRVIQLFGTSRAAVVGRKVEALLHGGDQRAVPTEPEPWTDACFANVLRDFEQKHGRLPTWDEFKVGARFGLPSINVFLDRFGTASAARILEQLRQSLGDDLDLEGNVPIRKSGHAPKWVDANILDAFRKFEEREGRLPTGRECCPENHLPHRQTLLKRYGTTIVENIVGQIEHGPTPQDGALASTSTGRMAK